MRVRDKHSFLIGLIQLAAVVVGYIYYEPLKDTFPLLILGLILAAAVHSFWRALGHAANEGSWKDFLLRGVFSVFVSFLGLLGFISGVLVSFGSKFLAILVLLFGMGCVDLAFWFYHRNDLITR